MLLDIIDPPYLALIMASLAGIAISDGLICALSIGVIEGLFEIFFVGSIFAFAATSTNTGGFVYVWLGQSDFINWILVIMALILIIAILCHVIRIRRRIITAPPAKTTEEE